MMWHFSIFGLSIILVVGCVSQRGEKIPDPSVSSREIQAVEAPRKADVGISHAQHISADQPMDELEAHHHQRRPLQNSEPSHLPEIGKQFLPPPAIPEQLNPLSDFGEGPFPASEPLALDVLETLACQNNPTLLQAQAQLQGTLGEAIQAGLWPNPTFMYVGEQIGVEGTSGEFQGGVVRQRIVTAGKLALSRAKYLARARVAEWMALAQQYRVLNDVRRHYFRARGHQELLEVQRELLKNAEDEVVTFNEMYNQGQATRAEVHQANVRLQQQRLEVLMAENDYRQSFEELTALVGADLAPSTLSTPLEGDLDPMDWDESLCRLLQASPQIMAARLKLESDRITIQREIAEPVPDIVVEGGTGHNFETRETVAMASVAIAVPIFDRNQGTIRQAEADYARQQSEVRRTELLLRRELAGQYRTYLTALQHVRNFAEVILPESRQAYELLLQGYKDNRAAWTEVLAAERQYFTLRGQYISHLIAWRESEVLILGYLLHDGLLAPSNPTPPGHINALPKPR